MLLLEDGTSKTLTDSVREHPFSASYTLHSFLAAAGFFVINVHYWEGGAFLLVSRRSGTATKVRGPPIVSPDNARLATAVSDLEAKFEPTGLDIWHISPDSLSLEWSVQPVTWGPNAWPPDSLWGPIDVEWRTPTELRFRKEVLDSIGIVSADGYATLVLQDGRWKLRPGA